MGPRARPRAVRSPVISRIWSLDHPIEIKSGMVFALETQHGKLFRWGVRIEEMLIVHEDGSRSSPTSRSSRSPWSIRCRATEITSSEQLPTPNSQPPTSNVLLGVGSWPEPSTS